MRHLDVLKGEMKDLTIVRATVLAAMRRWFEENGYLEVAGQTPDCFPAPNRSTSFGANDPRT
jgi:aspartyl/asparaginyl-tRNA synthetase